MYYRKQLSLVYLLKLNSHFMMVKAADSQPRGRGFKSFTFKTIILAQFILDQSATLKLCTTLTWHCCIFCKPVHCTLRMVSIWNPDDAECAASLSADQDQRTISKRTELTSFTIIIVFLIRFLNAEIVQKNQSKRSSPMST